jgi:acyl carrier protein
MLEVPNVGLDDNFFELGGHSLLMTKTHLRIQETLEQEISIVDLFSYPTIRTLANFLAKDDNKQNRVEEGFRRANMQKDALQRQRGRLRAIAQERSAVLREIDEVTDSRITSLLDKKPNRDGRHKPKKFEGSSSGDSVGEEEV